MQTFNISHENFAAVLHELAQVKAERAALTCKLEKLLDIHVAQADALDDFRTKVSEWEESYNKAHTEALHYKAANLELESLLVSERQSAAIVAAENERLSSINMQMRDALDNQNGTAEGELAQMKIVLRAFAATVSAAVNSDI